MRIFWILRRSVVGDSMVATRQILLLLKKNRKLLRLLSFFCCLWGEDSPTITWMSSRVIYCGFASFAWTSNFGDKETLSNRFLSVFRAFRLFHCRLVQKLNDLWHRRLSDFSCGKCICDKAQSALQVKLRRRDRSSIIFPLGQHLVARIQLRPWFIRNSLSTPNNREREKETTKSPSKHFSSFTSFEKILRSMKIVFFSVMKLNHQLCSSFCYALRFCPAAVFTLWIMHFCVACGAFGWNLVLAVLKTKTKSIR